MVSNSERTPGKKWVETFPQLFYMFIVLDGSV